MRPTNVEDVMSRTVVSVREDVPFKDLVRIMHEKRVGGVPIVDTTNRLVGIVTEADLLRAEGETRDDARNTFLEWIVHPARLAQMEHRAGELRAGDLMTKDVVALSPDTHLHDAIRTLLEAGVKRLPVVDAGKKVLGIVTRRDLLQPFLRADEDIHREVTDDVIHRTLWLDPAALKVEVKGGIVTLRGEVDRRSEKEILAALAWRVDGVVGVKDELSYRTDDRELRPEPPRSDLGWGENWPRPGS